VQAGGVMEPLCTVVDYAVPDVAPGFASDFVPAPDLVAPGYLYMGPAAAVAYYYCNFVVDY